MERTHKKSGIHIDAPMAQNIQKSTYLARLPFTIGSGLAVATLSNQPTMLSSQKVGLLAAIVLNMGKQKSRTVWTKPVKNSAHFNSLASLRSIYCLRNRRWRNLCEIQWNDISYERPDVHDRPVRLLLLSIGDKKKRGTGFVWNRAVYCIVCKGTVLLFHLLSLASISHVSFENNVTRGADFVRFFTFCAQANCSFINH